MRYKYNVSSSDTLNKKWTQQAIDCYQIGCNCSKCILYLTFFSERKRKCMMKNTVIELVRQIGIPKIKKNDIQKQEMVS